MHSANQVDQMAEEWKSQGLSKEEFIVKCAEAELGWPYVWGAVGAQCTPRKREYYANRDSCPDGEKDEIRKNSACLIAFVNKAFLAGEKLVAVSDDDRFF